MEIDYSNLISAINTLKTSMNVLDANRKSTFADMLEDSCIKRFEYSLEIARKLMKRVLKKIYGKTEEELTVNNTFRFMQGYKFILNWENWKNYYEKRNNTAYVYDLEKSRELLEIIPDFINDADFFISKLQEKLS